MWCKEKIKIKRSRYRPGVAQRVGRGIVYEKIKLTLMNSSTVP
jgi:hypothetical protein